MERPRTSTRSGPSSFTRSAWICTLLRADARLPRHRCRRRPPPPPPLRRHLLHPEVLRTRVATAIAVSAQRRATRPLPGTPHRCHSRPAAPRWSVQSVETKPTLTWPLAVRRLRRKSLGAESFFFWIRRAGTISLSQGFRPRSRCDWDSQSSRRRRMRQRLSRPSPRQILSAGDVSHFAFQQRLRCRRMSCFAPS